MKADARAFEHLEAGGLLIVETRESVRALRHAYDRAQSEAGRSVWKSARVTALDDWLAELWQEARSEHRDPRILLSDVQVARAFAAIIEADSGTPLLNVIATARAAMLSWRRLHDWGIDPERVGRATVEERSFHGWTRAFRQQQSEQGWLDRAQLAALIATAPPESAKRDPVAMLGFEERRPAIERLVESLGASGTRIERLAAPLVAARCAQHAPADLQQELIAAASWARSRIARDPRATLAIIVPDLEERRASVRALLDSVLDPESLLPTTVERLPLYSIIGGEALAEHAVVDAALTLLAMSEAQVQWTDAGRLLRCPYLPGWVEEAGSRARLDRHLRKLGRVGWTQTELVRLARDKACPQWADACEKAVHELGDRSARRQAGAWVERFGSALHAGGWPEGRPRTSVEHQAARRFRELLSEFAGLDSLLPALDLRTARRELVRLCHDTAFQPESGDPPIRVLDALDHPGRNYDGLWVTGLTAERWPRASLPDPFLALDLQRALGMPWASAAGELELARRATVRILGAARELVLSSPRQIEESESEPSPLIPHGLAEYTPADGRFAYGEEIYAARQIEEFNDVGPPISVVAETLRGGSRVVELQAKCPFRAFGELRLEAARLESPAPGISVLVRGQLLHHAFERLWRKLGSQRRLIAMPPGDLEAHISEAVDLACAELRLVEPRRLMALERQWLAKVIAALLVEERKRAPFSISELETSQRFAVGAAVLALKIDRIDELDESVGGGEVVLDYKTGRPTAARWLGSKRDLPQLPLYAISRPRPVAGLAFAHVNLRDPGFRGMAANDAARQGLREPRIPRVADTPVAGFAEQLEDWRGWVTRLVTDHVAGVARVDPVSPETCRECALMALCRIGTDAPVEEENGDGD